ncbi:uncharacterized protein LOC127537047 [Acanthochromis polyacanthus]|uniref:uncharacterized protein LOC127537047 n=1 Tax=Acanthochromis polyacanthus TaxID=80966 RepID=UPI0022340900|nr:uncharacterized protein LOC127537047 [Acanthochromis polyacanthus]
MTLCSLNIFLIVTVCLGVIFNPSHGFKVIQPVNQTVNPGQWASISCEHDQQDKFVVEDVRLYSILLRGKPSMLCQKEQKDCKNIIMYRENDKKFTFILLNIGPEEMKMTYQCEMTLKIGDIDYMEKGTPTRLLPGRKETEEPHRPPTNPYPDPPLPPQPGSDLVRWILIGLLTLTLLYSCIITSLYIRLMKSDDREECENSTYVEMRKAPRQRHADFSAYSG